MEQEVDFADATNDIVKFDPVDMRQSKILLEAQDLTLRPSSKLAVDPVPALEENLKEETAAPGGRVDCVVVWTYIEHCDREPRQLSHGKVLTEAATKDRGKELLKCLADAVYVSARERKVLENAHDLSNLRVWQLDSDIRRKDRRVCAASLGEQSVDSVRHGRDRLACTNLELSFLTVRSRALVDDLGE
jgi:hypothetical protein